MHLMNIDAEGFVGRVGGGGNVRSTLVYTHTTIWPREVVMAENIANQKRALGFCECGRWKAVNKNRHYRRESEIRQHLGTHGYRLGQVDDPQITEVDWENSVQAIDAGLGVDEGELLKER